MNQPFIIIWCALAAALALTACTEQPQTLEDRNSGHDTAAFQGPSTAFTAAGWKPGDKTSWEAQLKTRTQNQNEYTKVN
jgi:hypothetical protein